MIKLKDLIDQINEDKEIDTLDITEQIDIQTYYYLVEVMDTKNVYTYKTTDKFFASFIDQNGIKHCVRIIYQPLSKTPNAYVLKFWFFDKNGKISYERPNVIFNLNVDEKIFNTHIHIVIDDFLDKFFGRVSKGTKLYLPAKDYARYRLFRMALNKFLDKNRYNVYDDTEHKNTLVIEPLTDQKFVV
jgi:hypothetical protein